MKEKIRLDVALHQQGLAPSREKARAMIMAGEVSVDGQMIDKPGTRVTQDVILAIKAKPRFVSRGGDKLAGALDAFPVIIKDRICADVGASTGGFTDCLLQYGVAKVYAIDVGYGQLDYKLQRDTRVVVMDRVNVRYISTLPEAISLVVVDASFISLKLILPVVKGWLTPQADIIALIKPQFEAGKRDVGKGGVVRDQDVHERVLHEILEFAEQTAFKVQGLIPSPLKGPAGNIEFLVWLTWGDHSLPQPLTIDELITQAMNR